MSHEFMFRLFSSEEKCEICEFGLRNNKLNQFLKNKRNEFK